MNISCKQWLNGKLRGELEDALASSFSKDELASLVTRKELAKWEDDLPTEKPKREIIRELVDKCCREDRILDLVNAAASQNDGNVALQIVQADVLNLHKEAQAAALIPEPSTELNQQPQTPDLKPKSPKRGVKWIVGIGIAALLLAIIVIYIVSPMTLPGIMNVSPDDPALATTAVNATSQPAADAPPASACAALQVVNWTFDLTTGTDQTRSEDANNRIVLRAEETAGLASISGRAVLSANIGCDCTVTVDEIPMQQANCTFLIPQEGGNQAVELMVFVAQKPRDSVTVILGEP